MRLDKCDANTAKETVGYRWRKKYVTTAKRDKNQRGTKGKTNPQINNQSFPMRRREEPNEE